MAWRITALPIHATVWPHGSVCVRESELQRPSPRESNSIQGDRSCKNCFAAGTGRKGYIPTHEVKRQYLWYVSAPFIALSPTLNTIHITSFSYTSSYSSNICLCLFAEPAASSHTTCRPVQLHISLSVNWEQVLCVNRPRWYCTV